MIGVKSKNKYIGYTFAGLWTIGLVSGIFLAASITKDFATVAREKQEYSIVQPPTGKMIVKVAEGNFKVYGRFFKMDGLLSMTDDSIYLNNVRVRIVKSPDSLYHSYAIKSSHAGDDAGALRNAKEITYSVAQQDSLFYLSRGFAVQRGTRFRNQGVIVTIQVPVGKRIQIDRSVSRKLNWFNINNHGRDDWDEEWEDYQSWMDNVEYIMTVGGLERVQKDSNERENSEEEGSDVMEEFKKSKEELRKEIEKQQKELEEKKKELEKAGDSTNTYRYKTSTSYNEDNDEDVTVRKQPIASISKDLVSKPMLAIFRFID